MADVYEAVVGQESAVEQLQAAALRPVHAYLFVGPAGAGKRQAALSFAAQLVCPEGGCGECRSCRLAVAGQHPDVTVFERTGSELSMEQARELVRAASRSPVEGDRKVLVPLDLHLVNPARPAAAALLKAIEEPSESTVWVITAESVPPELVTIASRCVRVDFRPVSTSAVAAALVAEGTDVDVAAEVAEWSGGDVRRARLLAHDEAFGARRDAWRRIPRRLDGTGHAAAEAGATVLALIEDSLEPLKEHHVGQRAELAEQVDDFGLPRGRLKALDDRHRRELRRHRDDELRFGLGVLAGAYRDALVEANGSAAPLVGAVERVQELVDLMDHNPNMALQLRALLFDLPPLPR